MSVEGLDLAVDRSDTSVAVVGTNECRGYWDPSWNRLDYNHLNKVRRTSWPIER